MLEILQRIRQETGDKLTVGLSDETIRLFLESDYRLGHAIKTAELRFLELKAEYPTLLKMSEKDLIASTQKNFVNFYAADAINPYLALSAKGPWIISTCGAVIYDTGGYGMLGSGHAPDFVLKILPKEHVMANIMTASFTQLRFIEKMQNEVGQRRPAPLRNPYSHFIAMNSGSESMTVATRISDVNAQKHTSKGGVHEGKKIKFLALRGGFHGRTERPAQASDSSRRSYEKNLASFKGLDNLVLVEPNDVGGLRKAFESAEKDGVFFELMFMEPVMGEGNPGLAATPEFFKTARQLTKKMGTLLVVDSIQAGFRAQGYLSICDYPGFENLEAPDMESFSKALNAGQYPLSVLAMAPGVSALYAKGIYGNTMTGNPKALDVACAVLDHITEGLRLNIRHRGGEFVSKLKGLMSEFPGIVTGVQGTGLLVSCEINGDTFDVVGFDGIETIMRKNGIGVIHGGVNSLRFTPVFDISSAEIDLIITGVRNALKTAKKKR
jgi:acetylornithine/succinyldiaminopimelate/putrescine aminotransferase